VTRFKLRGAYLHSTIRVHGLELNFIQRQLFSYQKKSGRFVATLQDLLWGTERHSLLNMESKIQYNRTNIRHWNLSWASWIHFTSSNLLSQHKILLNRWMWWQRSRFVFGRYLVRIEVELESILAEDFRGYSLSVQANERINPRALISKLVSTYRSLTSHSTRHYVYMFCS